MKTIMQETAGGIRVHFRDLKNRDMLKAIESLTGPEIVMLHSEDITPKEAETLAMVIERPDRVQETRDVLLANLDELRAPKK